MGRKAEPGISYYPRAVDMVTHKKIKLLFSEFDSHGPWILDCLHAEIYKNKGYYLDISDKDYMLLFATDVCKKPVSLVNEIIQGCIRRGLFDKRVFDTFSVLTSDRIQETYIEATAERRRKGTVIEFKEELLLIGVDGRWQNVQILNKNGIVPRKNEIDTGNYPQSKVKESKVKESKGEGEQVPLAPAEIFKELFEFIYKKAKKYFPVNVSNYKKSFDDLEKKKLEAKQHDMQEEIIFNRYIKIPIMKEIEKMWNYYKKNEFRHKGGKLVTDWEATLLSWLDRREEFKK